MYKKFYITKSLINILLIGFVCFFMYFDEIKYVTAFLLLVMVLQLLFSFIRSYKFPLEAINLKSNMLLKILMALSIWAGLNFNRFFIFTTWILYVIIEMLMYMEVKEYLD